VAKKTRILPHRKVILSTFKEATAEAASIKLKKIPVVRPPLPVAA
jgi:hypothetical protein